MEALQPRPYQEEALDALDYHVQTKETNPCVVIPTGGGKSIIIAWIIQRWKNGYPPLRVIILAHRKELVSQNTEELQNIDLLGDIGIYSASLRKRDVECNITFAAIDSVYDKAGLFGAFDVIIVDEAHRIPAKGEGKYRRFINDVKKVNPNLRIIGFTATPFRMGCGMICHRDHILHEVCYSANVGDLIRDGFLCRLRSKIGDIQPDLTNLKANGNGDYTIKSLAAVVDTPEIVREAVQSAMGILNAECRKSIIFFCVDVKHCKDVSQELRKYGVDAPCITGKTPTAERDRIAERFKAGGYRVLCNVNCYTEGFNAKRVDAVCIFRPTKSKGMYVQMVGRGLRLHESKTDCLVLDYGRCIDTHGPIDCIDDDEVKLHACTGCGDVFSRVLRICPHCGMEIPKKVMEALEEGDRKEKEKVMHEKEAADRAILGSEPEELTVDDVTVHIHKKAGKPDSIRVQYRCGISTVKEWVCLDHPGIAGGMARQWWDKRFGWGSSKGLTVELAFDLFLGQIINDITESITVIRRKKHLTIIDYKLKIKMGESNE